MNLLISKDNYKINLYVTHLDAGYDDSDIEARKFQLKELSEHIKKIDNNYSFIICGDFNIDYYTSPHIINKFTEENKLDILQWSKNINIDEMIDYVFFKNGENEISIIHSGINSTLINKSDHLPIEFIITLGESN